MSVAASGSIIRAQSSSSTSRGEVVPRISISAVCTISAKRVSVAGAEAGSLVGHLGELVARHVDQAALAGVGHGVEQDQVAEPVEQVDGEPPRVVPGLDDAVDRAVDRRGVARGQRVDHVVEQRAVGDPEQRDRLTRR